MGGAGGAVLATFRPPETVGPWQRQGGSQRRLKVNALYKQKKFAETVVQYEAAVAKDPTDMAFVSNIAAAHFGMKDYERCIEA